MEGIKIEGAVVHVGDEIRVNDKFKKRELVVKTDGEYSQEMLIEFAQDKVDLLDVVLPNQRVAVHVNLRGRRYSKEGQPDRWFNSITGWKIDVN